MIKRKSLTEPEIQLRPRPAEAVTIPIPVDTLESLRRVAEKRDMSVDALLKFYIGQGLRQDLDRLFADYVLEATAEVLGQHLQSAEEIETILQEIRHLNTRRMHPWLAKPDRQEGDGTNGGSNRL